MTSSFSRQSLPSTAELPCSDDTPVDNEEQNLLPNLLLMLLFSLWTERVDWFFGVDMAVYHTTGKNVRVPVVPNAFLSIGVERRKNGKSRRSYAVWEEQDIVPIMTLEMVSHKPGGEYDEKMDIYARLGVLYYVVYNPEFWRRDRHEPFEVYKLTEGTYQLKSSTDPCWMPEVGIGIGRCQAEIGGLPQEILTWFDEQGHRHLSEAEQVELNMKEAEAIVANAKAEVVAANAVAAEEKERRKKLERLLKEKGIDLDSL